MKPLFPSLLQAKNPAELFDKVQKSIAEQHDLYASPFVDDDIICQWMCPGLCLYEYRLIDAADPIDLEANVQGLSMLGFELMFNLVRWNGRLVQWVQRMNSDGLGVKEVLTESLQIKGAESTVLPVVVAAQGLMRLAPVKHAYVVPFPLAAPGYSQDSTR